MRIFFTSDIHGDYFKMAKLRKVENIDLIIINGDIGGKYQGGLKELGFLQKQDIEKLDGILKNLKVPARYILGNDDWFEHESEFYLKKPEVIQGIKFIPFEWVSRTPFNTHREVNKNEMAYQLMKINDAEDAIIVAHTPPYGYGDILARDKTHCGSMDISNWIMRNSPLVWSCGHIHEDFSAHFMRGADTYIFNSANREDNNSLRGWIFDTESEEYENVFIY